MEIHSKLTVKSGQYYYKTAHNRTRQESDYASSYETLSQSVSNG